MSMIKGLNIIRKWVMSKMMKKSDDGIMVTLPDSKKVDLNTNITADRLLRSGVDIEQLNNPNQVENLINQINKSEMRVISQDDPRFKGIMDQMMGKKGEVFDMTGKKIKPGSKIMGGKAVDDLPPPGSRGGPDDIAAPVQSAEESLKDMIMAQNKKNIAKIKQRKKMLDDAIEDASPGFSGDRKVDAELVAENLAERRGLVYDDLPTKERLKIYDEAFTGLSKKKDIPEDFATGGRVGYKIGSIDKARRAFLKTAAGVGGGIAALKTGLLGLSKKAPEAVEKVTENFSTTLSEAPDYFFNLVSKIKLFGKKSKIGPQERVDEYSYIGKNGDQYTLTEDIATGDAQIVKDKMGVGSYGDKTFDTINDRTVMEYKAPRQDVDLETGRGTREGAEYEEYKVEFDPDGTPGGADAIDKSVQEEIIEEASEKITKKASGGIARLLGE